MSGNVVDLARVDIDLQPLLGGLRWAVEDQQVVIIHQLWHPNWHWALLPFHLHLRWPGTLDALPLSITFALIPFRHADVRLLEVPLYTPDGAKQARLYARAFRNELRSDLKHDFVHADWEEGFERHRTELAGKQLPAASYLAVDTVRKSGSLSPGTRPCLGRIATRNGFRPRVLVPAHGELSEHACGMLAHADVLLVDLQGVRGHRILRSIREVLRQRGSSHPTLILTTSPSDLVALGWEGLGLDALSSSTGQAPRVQEVRVTIVGHDRLQAEREFEFAVTELVGHSAEIDHLADLAKTAWWSGRQAVAQDAEWDPAFRRFSHALEQMAERDPLDARLLTAAAELLGRTHLDAVLAAERMAAVVEAALSFSGTGRTLILTRHGYSASSIRQAIAEASGTAVVHVSQAGIDVRTLANGVTSGTYKHAVSSGYCGLATIDTVLTSGAEVIHLVLDPIEARAAWWGARQMATLLERAGISDASAVLQCFCQALEPHLPPFADILPLQFDYFRSEPPSLAAVGSGTGPSGENKKASISIWCIDGTLLELPMHARIEVVDRNSGSRLRAVAAEEVRPGDELVVLDADAQSLFSERLMKVLDDGPLRAVAEKRMLWLTYLTVIMNDRRVNVRGIHRLLCAGGMGVNYHTVLRWLRPDAAGAQAVPLHWREFRALAQALAMNLPEDYLSGLYRAIREWRIRHRLEGRSLVRAMRAAHLGRLDGVTLARIEREWGLAARELIQSARLVEVDSVIAGEGGPDANL